MIVKTDDLHTVDRDMFIADLVHLKPAGRARLCIAYKQHVYPLLGKDYVPPSERNDKFASSGVGKVFSHRRDTVDQRSSVEKGFTHRRDAVDRRSGNKKNTRNHGHSAADARMTSLVNLLRDILQP